MSEKKLTIPEDVVNPKEYMKFKALEKHPLLRNTTITTSEGDELNIAMLPHRLKKQIEHLTPAEQDNILEIKRKWNSLRGKITAAKRIAYGKEGRYGGLRKEETREYRLSPFEEDIIELLGRMFTIAEVIKIMGEDNGIITTEEEVKPILKKHIVEVERKREEFRNRVSDVRLYSKRPRLEELAWMYSKMKNRYIALNNTDSYNAMLRTLEQIRKEAEGDVLNINGALDVNIEVTIQNHIQKEVLKTINLKEIILGRVAARMNYDPKKLVAGLHNSYYAKFVDISGDFDESAQITHPSQSAYDFTMIEKNAASVAEDISPEAMEEAEVTTATNVKDLFLTKIRKQKEEMERRQAGFDAEADVAREKVNPEDEVPIKRGKGSGKDKIIPSASKSKYKKTAKDYFNKKK